MGKPDPQTSGSEFGGAADESASAVGEVSGSEAPLSEDEKWGFTDKKSGMPSETKAGIAIVLVLIGAFGFIAYTKYGQGLKDKTLAAIKGKASDEVPDDVGEPAAETETPPAAPPSAFGPDDEASARVALNENDFLGDQGEPAAAASTPPTDSNMTAAAFDDGWGVADSQPAAPASATTPAAAEPDPFAGFESPQPAATPAVQTRVTATQDPVADFDAGDPFGDLGSAQSTPPAATQPAAPADGFGDWPPADGAAVAAREPATVQPREPAPMQPTRTTPPAAATDPFEGGFGDPEPGPAESVALQPEPRVSPAETKPTPDAFDDSAIFGDDPAPAREPASARVAMSEPVPRERTPVQPRTIPQPSPSGSDPFDDPGIDFDDGFETPPARTEVATQPARAPERFDRGVVERRPVERIDRTVSRPVESSDVSYYTVQQSDTYWSISKKVYGNSLYYRALAMYNERIIPDPRRMRPGTRLEVPSIRELQRLYPNMLPRVRTVSATRIEAGRDSGLYLDADGNPVYRVGTDDTLSRIAQRHLGRASSWADIYNLNRSQLSSPEAVHPGMILKMPQNASQVVSRRVPTRR